MQNLAQTILRKFPNITRLTINGNAEDPARMEALSGLFSHGQGLHEVDVSSISRLAAERLAGLNHLKTVVDQS